MTEHTPNQAAHINQHTGDEVWNPSAWRSLASAHLPVYPDPGALDRACAKLAGFPPLVTSFEIERLRAHIADAQDGKRFLLQGGDCAELLDDCRDEVITAKLKILLQMSVVLVQALRKPVIRVGRFAGQYAKPRSNPTEMIDGVELPSYFGDLVNRAPFDAQSRTPNPELMVLGYQHASVTLNFIRSLLDGGFADLHHPGNWDLSFMRHASLPEDLRNEYQTMTDRLSEALSFMEALGDKSIDELSRVEFFTSHEGLNLYYEEAQTRRVPRRDGWYDLTTHMPWIGERTRNLDGPHIAFFRGIRNPLGVKIGPKADPFEIEELLETLNPNDEPGKVILIHRVGAREVEVRLPPIVRAIKQSGRRVLWVCDPMHGNTRTAAGNRKTRDFDDILAELELAMTVHACEGTTLGGVHFELTGDDVTECVGGSAGITEEGLGENYGSLCDPRLNYQQALEMAFLIARRAQADNAVS